MILINVCTPPKSLYGISTHALMNNISVNFSKWQSNIKSQSLVEKMFHFDFWISICVLFLYARLTSPCLCRCILRCSPSEDLQLLHLHGGSCFPCIHSGKQTMLNPHVFFNILFLFFFLSRCCPLILPSPPPPPTAVTVCNHGNSQRLSRAYNR